MANCAEKLHHKTEREALNHLAWARKQRHQEGSHGIKHLNVYECPCGRGWCVGRAWRGKRERLAAQPKPEPLPKPRTFGEIRRKLARLEERWDRERRYRAAQLAKVVEADRLLWETEEEMRQLQYQVLAELGIAASASVSAIA
jgi:hypothetical protein